jgi:AraC family transcriptional regulator
MATDSLPKPSTLDGTVEVEVLVPHGTVQVNRYHWDEGGEAVFKSDVVIVDIALQPQCAPLECSYLETAREYRRVGDILVMAPDFTLHSRWDRGDRRSMCCALYTGGFHEKLDIDWGDCELQAALNMSSNSVRTTMLRIADEVLLPAFASEVLVESLCTALIVELHRHFSRVAPDDGRVAGGLSAENIRTIREMFEESRGQGPSVYELARRHDMSVRHFSRLFRKSTGETISDFAARIILNRAKSLLSDRRNLIKQVAYDCGFKSTSAFSFGFRRATGVTPQQFRDASLN